MYVKNCFQYFLNELRNLFKKPQCKHMHYYQYRWLESDGTLMHFWKCKDCESYDFGHVIGDPEGWPGECNV